MTTFSVKCGLKDFGSDEGKIYKVGVVLKESGIGNVSPSV